MILTDKLSPRANVYSPHRWGPIKAVLADSIRKCTNPVALEAMSHRMLMLIAMPKRVLRFDDFCRKEMDRINKDPGFTVTLEIGLDTKGQTVIWLENATPPEKESFVPSEGVKKFRGRWAGVGQ